MVWQILNADQQMACTEVIEKYTTLPVIQVKVSFIIHNFIM